MDQKRTERAFRAACLVAIALFLGAFSNSLDNSFHFDDANVIVGNIYIRSLRNVPSFFRDASTYTTDPGNALYRPLVAATLALDYWVGGGLKPRQFHISQIAMQMSLGVGVFFLFLRLMTLAAPRRETRWLALLAATLYAVHTTATEALNIVHVRSELLSTLGIVGSFLAYFHSPRLRRSGLYLVPMIVGTFAKTPAVMFVPMFLVYVVLFEASLGWPELFTRTSWPHLRPVLGKGLMLPALGAGVFLLVEGGKAPTVGTDRLWAWMMSGGDYLQTQPFVWLHYLRLFLLPIGLSVDSDWTPIPHWYDTRVVAGALFLLALLRTIWTSSRTPAMRPVSFGLAWFVLGLLPTSLFPLSELTNDHRPFLAYIGLSLAMVWGASMMIGGWAAAMPRWRPAFVVVGAALGLIAVMANAIGTHERNRVYLSEESLWRDVVEKSPASGRGLMNYGLTQMDKGRYEEAKTLFERAWVYTPNYESLEVNLGIVNGLLGQNAAAEEHFARALALAPGSPVSHRFFAGYLLQQGRIAEGISHLERAIVLSPADITSRYQLMAAYVFTGQKEALRSLAGSTLAILPGDPVATQHLREQGGS